MPEGIDPHRVAGAGGGGGVGGEPRLEPAQADWFDVYLKG
jgi:hypothetical protein